MANRTSRRSAQQLILLMPARSDNRLLFIRERNGKRNRSPKSCCACDVMLCDRDDGIDDRVF